MQETKETTKGLSFEQMRDQLWMLYFDHEKFNCLGIIELSEKFIKESKAVDFIDTPPLAFIKLDKIPDNEEAAANMLMDLTIISGCPNLYLLLEAIHENKSEEIRNHHLNVYEKFQKSISAFNGKKFASTDRVNKQFKWTSNEKGFLINQYNQKIIKFADPKLAQWVSVVGSQFSPLFNVVFDKTLSKMNGGNAPFFIGINGGESGTMSGKTERITKAPYEEAKKLLPELKWSLKDNLKNMKIILE